MHPLVVLTHIHTFIHTYIHTYRLVGDLVDSLVMNGVIPKEKIRHELMDVRSMLSPNFTAEPLLSIERGAMIKFGRCVYRVCE